MLDDSAIKRAMQAHILSAPSNEELDRMAQEWWKNHIGINFLDWNKILIQNTIPFRFIRLNKDLVTRMFNLTSKKDNNRYHTQIKPTISEFKTLLDPILEDPNYKNGFFIKLISRSPKDYLTNDDIKPDKLTSAEEAFKALVCSMRCFEDICKLVRIDKCYLVVRPYIDFEPANEFRVFVKDRKIIGITQYYYQQNFNYTNFGKWAIEHTIREFMEEIVIPNMSYAVRDYVADIVFNPQPLLLECNPYGLSDPCLLNYQDMEEGKYNSLIVNEKT